jgi:hypothetical protein
MMAPISSKKVEHSAKSAVNVKTPQNNTPIAELKLPLPRN